MYRIRYMCIAMFAILFLSGCAAMAPPAGPQLTQVMVDTYLGLQVKWDTMSADQRDAACKNVDLISPEYVYEWFLKDVCV